MRHLDLTPFYRSTVGFDRLFDLLDSTAGFESDGVAYPPYNIERLGDNEYRITMHVQELVRLGADIQLQGDTATIRGVPKLQGAQVMATDLRASVSLVIAGLMAEGETIINRVYHLDRGFERLEQKLSGCGASIARLVSG